MRQSDLVVIPSRVHERDLAGISRVYGEWSRLAIEWRDSELMASCTRFQFENRDPGDEHPERAQ